MPRPPRPIGALLLAAGLVLLLAALVLLARTLAETDRMLPGLALGLFGLLDIAGGLAILFPARPASATKKPPPPARSVVEGWLRQHGVGYTSLPGWMRWLRLALIAVLVGGGVIGFWNAYQDVSELNALRSEGRPVSGQVFNREIMPEGSPYGYVHYAYREGSASGRGRFRVPLEQYGQFRTGRQLQVTYLPSDPQAHRLGLVDGRRVMSRLLFWTLLLLNGLALIGLPLWWIETRGTRAGT